MEVPIRKIADSGTGVPDPLDNYIADTLETVFKKTKAHRPGIRARATGISS